MDKGLEKIATAGTTGPCQREYRLSVIAKTDNSLSGYIAAWDWSTDIIMKNYYFQRALEITRQLPTRMNYSKSYLFCTDIGKDEVANQLLVELKEKYPVFSCFHTFALKVAGFIK